MQLRALFRIFKKPRYLFLWLILSTLIFGVVVLWHNITLIYSTVASPSVSLAYKIYIIKLLGFITANFGFWPEFYAIIISILFAANLTIIIYYLRRRIDRIKKSGITLSFFGIIFSLFSLGCAACGPLFIVTILTWLGVSSILAFLPLQGQGFGIIGIILILFSIYLVSRHIENPEVCYLNSKRRKRDS